jgi:hypothetical protein
VTVEPEAETKGQIKESLRGIPRHPKTMKGVETDETLRGAGNKR